MIFPSAFRKNKIYFHVAVQLSNRHMTHTQVENLWQDLARRFRRHRFLRTHSCVLMSNHFHGLFEVPDVCYEMAESALIAEFRQVSQPTEMAYKNNFFKMRRLSCFTAYRQVYKYIYRNPLEAGLCARAELYPFSSLAELTGRQRAVHYVNDSMGVITNPFQILNWINCSEDSSAHFLEGSSK